MKKLFVFTLVIALLLVTVVPVLAAGGPPTGHGSGRGSNAGRAGSAPFALAGTISSLDPGALTVTITVASGNKLVKPYIGQNLLLQTTYATRFLLRNPDGTATPITYEDLVVGQNISASGQLADNLWTAGRITAGAQLICLP